MQFRVYCICHRRRRVLSHSRPRFGIYRLISPAIALATVGEIVAAGIATCSLKYCKHRENHDTSVEAEESSVSYMFQSHRSELSRISSLSMNKNPERDPLITINVIVIVTSRNFIFFFFFLFLRKEIDFRGDDASVTKTTYL